VVLSDISLEQVIYGELFSFAEDAALDRLDVALMVTVLLTLVLNWERMTRMMIIISLLLFLLYGYPSSFFAFLQSRYRKYLRC
jgi:hypothetical protein